jgi:hypothetical protein
MSAVNTIFTTLILSSGMVILNSIPWNFVFFLTQMIGFRLYLIHNKDEYLRIQKKVGKWCSHLTDNNKGYGYSIGYWYILSLSRTISNSEGDSFTVWIFGTEASYNNLSSDLEDKNDNQLVDDKITINIIDRLGSYWNLYFKKRTIKIPEIKPYEIQNTIINEIVVHQMDKKHTVVLLHGEPGTGKSMIGLLLANRLNGTYCDSLIPWQPGDKLSSLYADAEVSEENPLILALEEIDTAIVRIHEKIEPLHGIAIPIPVCDKMSWNNLLTHINRGLYPHLILVLTTNKTPDFFNDLDPSYIAKNRVDLIFEVK